MSVCLRLAATAVALSVISWTVVAQSSTDPDTSDHKSSRLSLKVSGGLATPKSKKSLTRFWKGGPAFSVNLLVRAAPGFWVGTGVDVSALWFRQANFGLRYPSVELQRRNMAWVNIFLLSRFGLSPGGPVHPYVEFGAGGSRLSGAEYKEIVDSVRVTYYEIPARTRLAMKFTGGIEITLSPAFAFIAEGALRYVHNDPNMGVGLLLQGGVRLTL
jgi:opacity protein-like surface antigen